MLSLTQLIAFLIVLVIHYALVSSQTFCGADNPKLSEDCTRYPNVNGTSCCFLTMNTFGYKTNMCIALPSNATMVAQNITEVNMGYVQKLKIECGKDTPKLQYCGPLEGVPRKAEDCIRYSNVTRINEACCYFKNGNTSLCFMGSPGINYDIFGIKIQCKNQLNQ